jgi:YegS/Rv2252/BmrU family lipid kinase
MPELLEAERHLKRVEVLFNPVCGTRDAEVRRWEVQRQVQVAGLGCNLATTEPGEGATKLAQQAVAGGMERILVCGGDGSMAEAAEALVGSSTALGVIPGGTANLLALNLGLPSDPEEATRYALTAPAYPTDIGRANGSVFLLMVGMGADAQMIRDTDREAKKRLGVYAYLRAAKRHLGRRFTFYTITIDGKRIRRRAQTVLVANLGRLTAGVELVPGTNPDDGLLEVAVVRARGVRDIAVVAARGILRRQQNDRRLEILRGKQIVIQTRRSQPIHRDGDPMPHANRLEVTVDPASLRIVRPAPDDSSDTLLPDAQSVEAGSPAPLPVLRGVAAVARLKPALAGF